MTTLARAPRGREIAAFATIATASALAAARPLPCLATTDDGRAPQPSEPPPRREHEHEHGQEEDTPDELPPAAAAPAAELPVDPGNRQVAPAALRYASAFSALEHDDGPTLHELLEVSWGGAAIGPVVDVIAAFGLSGPETAACLVDGFLHLGGNGDPAGAFLAGAHGVWSDDVDALDRARARLGADHPLFAAVVCISTLMDDDARRPAWAPAFEALRAVAGFLHDERRFERIAVRVIEAAVEHRLGLRGAR